MARPPLQRTSLVDSAVGALRSLIVESHLNSGDKLPTEPELMARLGVSRTVLREAVSRLQMLGMLDVRAGRGTTLGSPDTLAASAELFRTALLISNADLVQFNDLRTGIECQAVRLAAARVNDDDIAELNTIYEQMFATRRYVEFAERDCAFHLAIARMSGNVIIGRMLDLLQDLIIESIDQTNATVMDYDTGKRLHKDILNALQKRDPDLADAAMRRHMAVNDAKLKLMSGKHGAATRARKSTPH